MGVFSENKSEILSKLMEAEKQIAIKDELLTQKINEVEYLRKQVDKLQDAVLATNFPEAYREIKNDELAREPVQGLSPVDEEEKKKHYEKVRAIENLVAATEAPLFENADDMMDLLARAVGVPETESVHDNDES